MSVVDHMPYDEVYQEVRRNRRRDSRSEALAQLLAGLGVGLNNYAQASYQRQRADLADQRYNEEQAYRQQRDTMSDQRWQQQFDAQQQRYDRQDARDAADAELGMADYGDGPGSFLFGLQGAPTAAGPANPMDPPQMSGNGGGSPGIPDAFNRASPGARARYMQGRQRAMTAQESVQTVMPVLRSAMTEGVLDQATGTAYLTHLRNNPNDLDNVLNDIQERRSGIMKGKAEEEQRLRILETMRPNAERVAMLSPRHAALVSALLDDYAHGAITKASDVSARLAEIEDGAQEQSYFEGQGAEDLQKVNPRATPEAAQAAMRLRGRGIPVGMGDANLSGETRSGDLQRLRDQIGILKRRRDDVVKKAEEASPETADFWKARVAQAESDLRSAEEQLMGSGIAPQPNAAPSSSADPLDEVLQQLSPEEITKLLRGG